MSIAPVRKFTTAEYRRMAEVGVLSDDERVELLDGEVVQMSPMGPRHSGVVGLLIDWLTSNKQSDWAVQCQAPLHLGSTSMPEPDLMLLAHPPADYRGRYATAADVLLLIEVSDASRQVDLTLKRRLYAEADINEYWVVDLAMNAIVVHRDPDAGDYRDVQSITRDSEVAPLAAPPAGLRVVDVVE